MQMEDAKKTWQHYTTVPDVLIKETDIEGILPVYKFKFIVELYSSYLYNV